MKDLDLEKFSKNFRGLRISRGFTQESFAEAIDTTHSTVNRWESGVHVPKIGDAFKIIQVFGITFEELCGVEKVEKSHMAPTLAEALYSLEKHTGIVLKLPKVSKKINHGPDTMADKIASLNEKQMGILQKTLDTLTSISSQKKKAN